MGLCFLMNPFGRVMQSGAGFSMPSWLISLSTPTSACWQRLYIYRYNLNFLIESIHVNILNLDFVGWEITGYKEVENLHNIILLDPVLCGDSSLCGLQIMAGRPEMLDGQWIRQYMDHWRSGGGSHCGKHPLPGQCHQDPQVKVANHQKLRPNLISSKAVQTS